MKNKISATIDPGVMAQIKSKITEIAALTPFLITLTDEDRKGGLKMGDKSLPFVGKTIEYISSAPEFKPAFLDEAELVRDFNLATSLEEALRQLRPLVQRFEDTAQEAGVEAMAAALLYYGNVKSAAEKGIGNAPEIFSDLAKRFPGKTKTQKPPSI
jgi:hypothetical protein